MVLSTGKNVTVNIWGKGITFQGKVQKWDNQEVIVNELHSKKMWTFPYSDILNGKVKVSPRQIH